jgi:hypothetical protein
MDDFRHRLNQHIDLQIGNSGVKKRTASIPMRAGKISARHLNRSTFAIPVDSSLVRRCLAAAPPIGNYEEFRFPFSVEGYGSSSVQTADGTVRYR